MSNKNFTISVRVTEKQFNFLKEKQAEMEKAVGMDVPLGALMRRLLDGFMEGKFGERPRVEATDEERQKHAEDFLNNY